MGEGKFTVNIAFNPGQEFPGGCIRFLISLLKTRHPAAYPPRMGGGNELCICSNQQGFWTIMVCGA